MKKLTKAKADDRPNERDLGWYHQWGVLHRRLGAIAAEANAELLEVRQAVDKVDAWMRTRVIEDVPSLRRRHSETLEQLTSDCLRKWNGSDQVGMAEQARKFLADLRRLWNVDVQAESESDEESEPMDWPPGMTRNEAIQHQIDLLQKALHENNDESQATARPGQSSLLSIYSET
ncbi:MAG: hypothetical protein JWP89_3674 [Schlesneria sp.]|nr:hypothetical protein [Schlesneria sp.]